MQTILDELEHRRARARKGGGDAFRRPPGLISLPDEHAGNRFVMPCHDCPQIGLLYRSRCVLLVLSSQHCHLH